MSSTKPSLEEMMEAVQQEADGLGTAVRIRNRDFPDAPPLPATERRLQSLTSAAHVLRIMGTFEDKSRKFVEGLLEEHRRS